MLPRMRLRGFLPCRHLDLVTLIQIEPFSGFSVLPFNYYHFPYLNIIGTTADSGISRRLVLELGLEGPLLVAEVVSLFHCIRAIHIGCHG